MRIPAAILLLCTLGGTLGSAPVEPALHRSELIVAPSPRQVAGLPRFTPRWVLPAPLASHLGAALREQRFSPGLAHELVTRLTIDPAAGDAVIVPDRELLSRFGPDERVRWAELLALHPGNVFHRWPLSLGVAEMQALEAEPRWREATARLRALSRPHGDRLVFSDLFALEDAFAQPRDRADFFRRALGAPAPVLKLRRAGGTLDPEAQAAWWQVNGRHRAIEPLLNAVAGMPNAPRLDVAHLLPRLPRSLLNTFPPELAGAADPGGDSGLLASEFFALSPGVDPDAPGGLSAWLGRECVEVTDAPRYGDLLVYGRLDRTAWPYTAVYIAGGFGFARRPVAFGPWQFLELADIGRLNPRYAGLTPRRFRPRSALAGPGDAAFTVGQLPEAWRRQRRPESVKAGPWGRLRFYDVLLAPSGQTLERLPPPDPDPVWTFAGVTAAELRAMAGSVEMTADTRQRLLQLFGAARPDADGRLTVHPPLDLVLAIPREFRARAFPHLVGGGSITDYAQHIPFPAGFTIEEWFEAGSLPESVRQAILRLVYPAGDRAMLSDFGALYHLLPTAAERLSAQRAALRVPAVVVLLEKPEPAEVPALAAYWQPGRAKDVERLLASFAASNGDLRYLDIIHLLSPIEREFLNTYFTPDGPSRVPSCFWAAFNFGAEKPDDRYLVLPGAWSDHEAMAGRDLAANFDPLPAPGRLGDIIAYRRRGTTDVVHVCVFIADGIVFTKNGATFSKPWCLSRLTDIDELYLDSPDMERVYFRRRSAAATP